MPETLREDFCGTASICAEWVRNRPERQAIGVDLDPEPLAWGKAKYIDALTPEEQKRVRLVQGNVLTSKTPKADVLAAQNFSFWVFKTRDDLRTYFEAAHRALNDDGVMVMDMMGGAKCMEDEYEETRRVKGFTYVWEHAKFDPITHDALFHIHFRFPDGSRMEKAFTYDWRLWTLPEVRELLAEAGFSKSEVYWEDTDTKSGEGNGTYRRRTKGQADPAWISYLVGVK
jgi:SAM-dependent methyltransferase